MILALGVPATAGRGVNLADLDPSVAPCRDFFQYANGSWIRRNPIPADQSTWSGFNEVKERNRLTLKAILDQCAAAGAPAGSPQRMVGDFYASGMDVRALERAGAAPLGPVLARIGAVRDARGLASALAAAHLDGTGPGFSFQVGQDDERSSVTIAQFAQGGLGLPDRDYYLRTDGKSRRIRARYRDHVARMLALLGEPPGRARADAGAVLELETRLAAASMTRVERRDPHAVYHRMTLAELAAIAPDFDWAGYLEALGVRADPVLVRQPEFFRWFSALVREAPPARWRAYLRWHAVHAAAPSLAPRFEREHCAFYGKALSGIQSMSPRWKRVQDTVDQDLGEALGRLFVERAFHPEAKARALELVANLRLALEERIRGLDWMGEATRTAALAKAAALRVKIGYPDRWRDYTGLEVVRGDYAGNVLRARRFEVRRNLAKLGRPVDRDEWEMTPPTVNAYYNPLLNEIVFPAGILQPPFFDPEADDAVNYGAIGMVIGHELTHGFDDEGRQYDAQGNLKEWWTAEDSKAFAARAGLVVQQFDALEALPGLHVNGRLTLGENIADLGGLKLAFAAYRKSLEGRPRPADIDGFTAEQRFFLGYAKAWRFQAREEAARMRVLVDPHAPPRFRVNAPLANLPEFIQAFGCGEGAPMCAPPGSRPAIW
ncbi:MAG: M13 family metallopeptidase [Holophaga sp.]|jgi:predicted metalloendopeptidase